VEEFYFRLFWGADAGAEKVKGLCPLNNNFGALNLTQP
jgi:hypothetical protein